MTQNAPRFAPETTKPLFTALDTLHDDLGPIAFEERSNGRHLCRFTVDGEGTAMVTLETDSGRLSQLCMRVDRETLIWIAATAEGMVHTLDRLDAREQAA